MAQGVSSREQTGQKRHALLANMAGPVFRYNQRKILTLALKQQSVHHIARQPHSDGPIQPNVTIFALGPLQWAGRKIRLLDRRHGLTSYRKLLTIDYIRDGATASQA